MMKKKVKSKKAKKSSKKAAVTNKLFHVGDAFYTQSGSMMSSIYHIKDQRRSDWGKVQLALAAGEKVSIRPATQKEMLWALKMLEEVKRRR